MADSSSTGRRRRSKSVSYQTKRYYKRHKLSRNWWPGGLLPLLLLALLFLWGIFRIAPNMQADTEASVAEVLRSAGYDNLQVVADGQQVQIQGAVLTDDEHRIKRIARGTTCDTFWSDNLVCPTHVELDGSAAKAVRHYDFSFVRSDAGVILRGEVPNPETHIQILSTAKSRFDVVIDSMRVAAEESDARYEWALGKAWPFLGAVNAGRIAWTKGVLSAAGRTLEEQAEQIRSSINSTQFPDRIGDISLLFEKEVEQCNQQFSQILGEATILFDTGSDVISSQSKQQLAAVAEVAGNCSGDLVIEGHTDNVGEVVRNQALSQRRAQAVVNALVQLGINTNRLRAVGYGESRPKTTNETSRGRAANRRIEIRVADFN